MALTLEMSQKLIKEWLAEYKMLAEDDIPAFADALHDSDDIQSALLVFIESKPSAEALSPVSHQLFEFYRSGNKKLKKFALEFLPSLICLYLVCLNTELKKNVGGVEAFLLAVYNLEILDDEGKAKVKQCRIPSYDQQSVYHDPHAPVGSAFLNEAALRRMNYNSSDGQSIWQAGPYPQYEVIHAQNRQAVLAYLFYLYNSDIANLSSLSLLNMCQACSRIVTAGFSNFYQLEEDEGQPLASFRILDNQSHSKRRSQVDDGQPKITVSPALLVEMLSGLYFIMHNGHSAPAIKATVDIHHRASMELYADVLLVTNAIRNSLQSNATGHADSPMGISISLTPATSGHTISKSAITNASFRAKKLPDDITVPGAEETSGGLHTIEEDSDNPSSSAINRTYSRGEEGGEKHFKLSKGNLFGRRGDKSKPKMKDGEMSPRDSGESVQVGVVKGNSRVVVDSVEMAPMGKKHQGDSDQEEKDKEKDKGAGGNLLEKIIASVGSAGKDSKKHGSHAPQGSQGSGGVSESTDL